MGKEENGGIEASWSPSGSEIAFVKSVDSGSDIFVFDLDNGTTSRVTSADASDRSIAWGPKGDRIAFISDRQGAQDIYVADLTDGSVSQVTKNTNSLDEYRWSPVWGPEGREIAYVSSRSGRWKDDLWIANLETGSSRKVTSTIQVMSTPIWSHDSNYIALNAVKYSEFWYGDQSDIYLINMENENYKKLEMNTFVSDRNGSINMEWGPNGSSLFFRYLWEGSSNIWKINIDDDVATKVTYQKGSISDFHVKGDYLFSVRSLPDRGDEIHRYDRKNSRSTVISSIQDTDANIISPKKISYESVDGKRMLGYLYLPPNFDSSATYPGLIQVHGGGNNAQGYGYHSTEHYLSQLGYVVLAIEYRGSAGHGRAFQDLSRGDWASYQGWDAIAAGRFLERKNYINEGIGIYGGSYGGIMTLSALTRSQDTPFAAAAPLYGIYHWKSAFQNGDRLMRFWIVEGHKGYKPDERPSLYNRTSTINHLEKIDRETPFLIMHGEQDIRAPFQQSVMLKDSLKSRGNDVSFHSFPDEGHGFSKPENIETAYTKLVNFFDANLR